MYVQGNDAFSRKCENCVVLTTMNTEYPGQSPVLVVFMIQWYMYTSDTCVKGAVV